jgi:5'-nucleotidase
LFHQRPTSPAVAASPDVVRITLVGTNDIHGWIEPREPTGPNTAPMIGGIDIFAGYLNILRAQRPDSVVLVDAGDLFQGTLIANATEGAAMIKAFNLLHYDATAVGNHEFDYGPEGEGVVALTKSEDPVGALKKRISEADFPFLPGNIFERESGQPVEWSNAPRTTIVRRQGINIGIIGLSTPTTPSVTLKQNVAALDFRPLVPIAKELATKLREQGAQIIIVTMHAGAGCPLENDPHDLSRCEGGELFPFLEALPEGTIDAVVAGHTHQYLAQFVNGVPAIQSKSYGEAFGVIELAFNRSTGKLDPSGTHIWKPTPLCRLAYVSTHSCKEGSGPTVQATFLGQPVGADPRVVSALEPDLERVEERKNELLGPRLAAPFLRSRTGESSLGDLVADVMKEKISGAQVGFMNSGGLRADLDRGPMTYGRVFKALPFENRLAVLQLSGTQLLAMVSRGLVGDHGVLQISGLQIEVADPKAVACGSGAPRLLGATLDGGTAIVPEQMYTVVTNDFIAGGGDGFDEVLKDVDTTRIQLRADLPPVREMVVSYFRTHQELTGPSPAAEPRFHFVSPRCAPQVSSQ